MLQLKVSDGLILQELRETDAPAMFALIEHNRDHLRLWLPWVDATRTQADSLSFIQDMRQRVREQKALAMGIFYQDGFIGAIDMHDWNHELGKAAIGYWLGAAHQKKGIMQACASVFFAHLFRQLPLNKLELYIVTGNKRSLKLAASLGFTTEGVLRASYKMNGALHDLAVWGLLQPEWANSQLSLK